jgi:hypothetical protein
MQQRKPPTTEATLLMNLIRSLTEFSNLRFLEKKMFRNLDLILAVPRRGENSLQMWKAADNMRKSQPRTIDKGDPPVWGCDDGLKKTPSNVHHKSCYTLYSACYKELHELLSTSSIA